MTPALAHAAACSPRCFSARRSREARAPRGGRPVRTACAANAEGDSTSSVPQPGPRRYAAVLGGEDFILSQRSGVEDTLFKGTVLGVDADVATVAFRSSPLSTLSELDVADFYLPPRFLDAVARHCVKHYAGRAFPGRAPPLLAVWGPKGCGKSLLLKLACRTLGISPVILSASELEDPEAGQPGRRVASRYALAAASMATEGRPTMLVVDDLDQGIGIFRNTLRTVNSQNVAATLMALCDDPERGGGARRRDGSTPVVPIVFTANDLSSIYAPLLRDGRTEKFYWRPTREETAAMAAAACGGALSTEEAMTLVEAFPDQEVDFFAALVGRGWDKAVQAWVDAQGSPEGAGAAVNAALREACAKGADPSQPPLPCPSPPPDLSLAALMAAAEDVQREQALVRDTRLSREYLRWSDGDAAKVVRVERTREQRMAARADAARAATQLAAARAALLASNEARFALQDATRDQAAIARLALEASAPVAPPPDELPWERMAIETAASLVEDRGASPAPLLVDLRSAKCASKTAIFGAMLVPCCAVTGSSLAPVVHPVASFASDLERALAVRAKTQALPLLLLLLCPAGGAPGAQEAQAALHALAQAALPALPRFVEVEQGAAAWTKLFTPTGIRRQKGAWGGKTEHSMWTASN